MKYNILDLSEAVKTSYSYSEVLRAIGVNSISGAAYKNIKRAINEYNLDTRHFLYRPKNKISFNKKHYSEILSINDNQHKRDSFQLRRALIESGVSHVCNRCGLSSWMEHDIVLEIHHINGINYDNRSENLEFLCPNCHSLTPNFYRTSRQYFCKCGKPILKKSKMCSKCHNKSSNSRAKRKTEWPTKEYLLKLIKEKPITHIALQFGVTDSCIIKWCKIMKVPTMGRGYWQKQTGGKKFIEVQAGVA